MIMHLLQSCKQKKLKFKAGTIEAAVRAADGTETSEQKATIIIIH